MEGFVVYPHTNRGFYKIFVDTKKIIFYDWVENSTIKYGEKYET